MYARAMGSIQSDDLREAIARVIATEKAYNVPALCVRLGLDDGDESEAMISKARYASSRLAKLPADRLVSVARALLEETDDFGLRKAADRLAERDMPPVSDLTRRRLLGVFDDSEISTEYDEIDFIERILPISSMRGDQETRDIDDWNFRSLKDDISQQMRRNDDWSNRDRLERLGLMQSSRAQLFRFLEASVHPTTVDEVTQKRRVERINKSPARWILSDAQRLDVGQRRLRGRCPRHRLACRRRDLVYIAALRSRTYSSPLDGGA